MGPLEVIFGIIVIFVTLVAVARGYPKELGNTVIILATIFVLSFFEARLVSLLTPIATSLLGGDAQTANLLLSTLFEVLFIIAVFASYAGITFDFPGRPQPAPIGPALTLAIGLLNGYLIAGTLWYYQARFDYPTQLLGLIQLPLTATGQALVGMLPQTLFDSPVYWMIPVAALIILRVRG
ncbi:MAG: hypothetical protein KF832_15070 [Caldilineaceae bacterium]|nr:hypothetical protein [Caldilineaceae bacterium]